MNSTQLLNCAPAPPGQTAGCSRCSRFASQQWPPRSGSEPCCRSGSYRCLTRPCRWRWQHTWTPPRSAWTPGCVSTMLSSQSQETRKAEWRGSGHQSAAYSGEGSGEGRKELSKVVTLHFKGWKTKNTKRHHSLKIAGNNSGWLIDPTHHETMHQGHNIIAI